MNFSQKLLTELKDAHGLRSDYKASLVLGITKQSISNIKLGKNQFSDETTVKIANLLGQDPTLTLINKNLEADISPEMRLVWEGLLADHNIAKTLDFTGSETNQVA